MENLFTTPANPAALSAEISRLNRLLDGGNKGAISVPLHTASSKKILALLPKAGLTPAERKTFDGLTAEHARIQELIKGCTPAAADAVAADATAKLHANPSAENAAALRDIPDKHTLRLQYVHTRRKLYHVLETFQREKVAPFVLPLIERAGQAIAAHADELMKADEALTLRYGLPSTPSPVSHAVWYAAYLLQKSLEMARKSPETVHPSKLFEVFP